MATGSKTVHWNNDDGRPDALEFEEAMSDFRAMFPGLDPELIEAVLRSQHGSVDGTIDQLLHMNLGKGDGVDGVSVKSSSHAGIPSSNPPRLVNLIELVSPDDDDDDAANCVDGSTRDPPTDPLRIRSQASPNSAHQHYSSPQIASKMSPSHRPVYDIPDPPSLATLTEKPAGGSHVDFREAAGKPTVNTELPTLRKNPDELNSSGAYGGSSNGNYDSPTYREKQKSKAAEQFVSGYNSAPGSGRRQRRFNPPLIGQLPSDFLRLTYDPPPSYQSVVGEKSPSSSIGSSSLSLQRNSSNVSNGGFGAFAAGGLAQSEFPPFSTASNNHSNNGSIRNSYPSGSAEWNDFDSPFSSSMNGVGENLMNYNQSPPINDSRGGMMGGYNNAASLPPNSHPISRRAYSLHGSPAHFGGGGIVHHPPPSDNVDYGQYPGWGPEGQYQQGPTNPSRAPYHPSYGYGMGIFRTHHAPPGWATGNRRYATLQNNAGSQNQPANLHKRPGRTQRTMSYSEADRVQRMNQMQIQSVVLQERLAENAWQRQVAKDPELDRFLADERIAIMMQNKELLRELRRDPEFVAALESDISENKKVKKQKNKSKDGSKSAKAQRSSLFGSSRDSDNVSPSASQAAGSNPSHASPVHKNQPPLSRTPTWSVDDDILYKYDDCSRPSTAADACLSPAKGKERIPIPSGPELPLPPAERVPYGDEAFPYTKELPRDAELDVAFLEKLKYMSKNSKRRFALAARRFSRKQKGAKGMLGTSESQTSGMCLLDSTDDPPDLTPADMRRFGLESGYDQPTSEDEDDLDTYRKSTNLL